MIELGMNKADLCVFWRSCHACQSSLQAPLAPCLPPPLSPYLGQAETNENREQLKQKFLYPGKKHSYREYIELLLNPPTS